MVVITHQPDLSWSLLGTGKIGAAQDASDGSMKAAAMSFGSYSLNASCLLCGMVYSQSCTGEASPNLMFCVAAKVLPGLAHITIGKSYQRCSKTLICSCERWFDLEKGDTNLGYSLIDLNILG